MERYLLLAPILVPAAAGLLLLILPEWKNRGLLMAYVSVALTGTGLLVCSTLLREDAACTLFYLMKDVAVMFHPDRLGKLFAAVLTVIWIAAGFYSFPYMEREGKEKRFYGFYLILYGVLLALDFSGNLITFYLFYELMTLISFPLVIHSLKKEAIMAGLKYLFYSFFGAYLVLFGIYFLYRYGSGLEFGPHSILKTAAAEGNKELLLVAVFAMILGFSVKAGMFPLHAWLPAAHPVAPAPASSVFSAMIVKAGVLGSIRVVYDLVGPDFIRGTWVQQVWLTLSLTTVFMGSMLAYREKQLKKRLAYSTVSQVSYILFGLALLNPAGYTGAVLHVVFHALIKCGLFLTAGAVAFRIGKTRVDELRGIGKEMPITIWCFTLLSLALIGIPPFSGFISKWYLGMGALDSGIAVFSWLGPVVLLISALLTAGYLLPVTAAGFFPGNDFDYAHLKKLEPPRFMWIPILILTLFAVLSGIMPNFLSGYIISTAAGW